MTIRKITGLEGGFSIVPNSTLNDNLSWEAIGLLAYLCAKPDDWEVSVTQLVNHSCNSTHPSKRDKTYRILNELEDAGYVQRLKGRNRGRFTGVEYVVSPTPLPKNIDDEPFTDLPDTVLPDTVKPTQQNKDSNKERKKQNGEQNSPDLFDVLEKEPDKPKRKKHRYTQEFEQFFKSYPKTKGSKLEASRAWKALNKTEKQLVSKSLDSYKIYLERENWQKPMYPARYIRDEHYLSFYAPEGVLKPAESVLIEGKGFAPETLIDLCTGYFLSQEWKYTRLLGPEPDNPESKIPSDLIEQAKKAANGKVHS